MNCFECPINIREDYKICKDIFNLLNILGIPLQEQITLWHVALDKISCKGFKDILLVLIKRQGIDETHLPINL